MPYTLRAPRGREALGTLSLRPWARGRGYTLTASLQNHGPHPRQGLTLSDGGPWEL